MPGQAHETPTERLRDADLDAWIRSGAWRAVERSAAPVLPPLAVEMLLLAQDPEVAPGRVATAVSRDPVLATRVLGFANVASQAAAVAVTSIGDAVLRLGTRTVCNLALADQLAPGFQDPAVYGPRGQALREHSIGTAYVAYLLADSTGLPSDEAFLCGLMHDIGKLFILKLAYDYGTPSLDKQPSARLRDVIEDLHPEMGGHLLRLWGLPDSLHEPVIWHHEPWRASREPRAAAVTYLANRLAHRYGFGVPRDTGYDPLVDHEAQELGLTAALLSSIDARAPGLFGVARGGLR